MRPRTIILESDKQLRERLAVLLTSRGHEVQAYSYPVICPLYQQPDGNCPQEFPCFDILITDMEMAAMSGLDLLRLQAEKGCKAKAGHVLLLAADLSESQKYQAERLGCTVASKPLQIAQLFDWIAECESHLQSGRHLGTIQFYS